MNMEAVRRPSPEILLEEYIPILMNFLALLPHLSGRIDLPAEARRNVNPLLQEDILILMNSLVLRLYVSGRSIGLLADHDENRWTSLAAITTEMLNCSFRSYDELYSLLSDLLSEARRGRAGSHSCGEGSSSHSEALQAINDGSAVRAIPACEINYPALKNKASIVISENGNNHFVDSNGSPRQREELKRNKVGCSGMTASTSNPHSKTPEIRNDSHKGIDSPPGPYVSIDIPSVDINQEYEENVEGGLDGRRSNEIQVDRINSPREPYVSIDVPSVVEQQQPGRKKRDNSMISETTLAITAQAVGTLVSSSFSASSHLSWTANLVAVATVYGIAFTVLGIGLRRVKPKLSGIMEKLGAVVTASAIILALGLTVVPAVAWTAGVVACLIIAFGVAMA